MRLLLQMIVIACNALFWMMYIDTCTAVDDTHFILPSMIFEMFVNQISQLGKVVPNHKSTNHSNPYGGFLPASLRTLTLCRRLSMSRFIVNSHPGSFLPSSRLYHIRPNDTVCNDTLPGAPPPPLGNDHHYSLFTSSQQLTAICCLLLIIE